MSDLRKAAEMALEAWAWDWSEPRNEALRERMEALRQALAQPEEKMRIEGSGKLTTKPYPDGYESERDFRKALAQPEQEPVAWGFRRKDGAILDIKNADEHEGYEKIYTVPLYTTPSNREWVGLTDEELLITYGWIPAPGAPDWILNGAKEELLGALRKVEAKLKEKNT